MLQYVLQSTLSSPSSKRKPSMDMFPMTSNLTCACFIFQLPGAIMQAPALTFEHLSSEPVSVKASVRHVIVIRS